MYVCVTYALEEIATSYEGWKGVDVCGVLGKEVTWVCWLF